jgi:small subunit ribosomal protein S2e
MIMTPLFSPALQATFYALQATYGFLSPELWTATRYTKSPLQEFTDFLAKPMLGDKPALPPLDF